jgi:hypothetical protein
VRWRILVEALCSATEWWDDICANRRQERIKWEFYETLQIILDEVNKIDYIMLIGDLNDSE